MLDGQSESDEIVVHQKEPTIEQPRTSQFHAIGNTRSKDEAPVRVGMEKVHRDPDTEDIPESFSPEEEALVMAAMEVVLDARRVLDKRGIYGRLGFDSDEDKTVAAVCLADRMLKEEIGRREGIINRAQITMLDKMPGFSRMVRSLETSLDRRREIQQLFDRGNDLRIAPELDMTETRYSVINRAVGTLAAEVFYNNRLQPRIGNQVRFKPSEKLVNEWVEKWKPEIASTAPMTTVQDSIQ